MSPKHTVSLPPHGFFEGIPPAESPWSLLSLSACILSEVIDFFVVRRCPHWHRLPFSVPLFFVTSCFTKCSSNIALEDAFLLIFFRESMDGCLCVMHPHEYR